MNALGLIVQREFYSRIKKKSFIILTIATPFLLVALIFVPLLLSQIKDSKVKDIVVIDNTNKYASSLKSSEHYAFQMGSSENIDDLKAKLGNDIFGVLQIDEDLGDNPKSATLYSEKQAPAELTSYINKTFSKIVENDNINKLANDNEISSELVVEIQQLVENSSKVQVSTVRWNKDGSEKETSADKSAFIGMIFTMLMYMFILMYGSMVLQGVIEEKSSRIVEVMISSVKPYDLMMGKIIGIGLTGLFQLVVWIVVIFASVAVAGQFISPESLSPENIAEMQNMHGGGGNMMSKIGLLSSVNFLEILIYFVIMFIGGYLIYASLFAMFGAAVDNAQDAQQLVMPVTIIFIFALYAGLYSIQNPDGPLAFWSSMIPLTSPIVMMVRIPFEIPLWEKLLSVAILYVTIFFVVKFAAKIYRVGILMYGKKPTLKELFKWMSYK